MKNKELFNKTRIAPTPSGYLHTGNAFSFLLTAALAKKYGAEILLRIDDLDKERVRKEYIQDIFHTLDYLDIHYQQGPVNEEELYNNWSQTTRIHLYNDFLTQLAGQGLVYACDCSRQQVLQADTVGRYPGTCRQKSIPLNAAGVNWRIKTDHSVSLLLHDWLRGPVSVTLPEAMHDFVVRKKDGLPAYQLASLTDDHHFGIDLIVRGQDLWDSTLAQLYLSRQLGLFSFEKVVFLHHPLLVNQQGGKLSKSAGDTSIRSHRERGIQLSGLIEGITSNPDIRRWLSDIDINLFNQ